MKRISKFLVLSLSLTIIFITSGAYAKAPESFANQAEKLLPAVVNISSTQIIDDKEKLPKLPEFPPGSPFEDFFEEFMDRRYQFSPSNPPASLGSGFIIDAKNGYIVTNNHVIKDADEVRVTLHDDTTLEATIIGFDEKTDLALLKVDPEAIDLKDVKFGNSDEMRVGDWVLAIGNPFGLGGTVTAGIISARQRNINAGPYDDFLQTDASINRGNSGGPMFNMDGEVIGINTAIYSPSGGSVGIGFAIPSNLAKPVIEQLIKYGKTRRGWLGVRIQSVTDEIAESLGLDEAKGALVASVAPNGPADKAKIQAGDIIIQFNGKTIREMRTLPRIVAETPIGEKSKVTVWRNGKKITLTVEIGELEKAEEEGLVSATKSSSGIAKGETKIKSVGITIASINSEILEKFGITRDDISGVIVTDIEKDSEAAKKGIRAGDIILEINQQTASTPQKALSIIEKAEKSGRKSVLMLVDHGGKGDVRFIAIKIKK